MRDRSDITIRDLKIAVRAKYAWPGGYPLFCITDDGASLCIDCARTEFMRIARSIKNRERDGWRVVAADVNWEDSQLYCDHCGDRIESAYAEDDAED